MRDEQRQLLFRYHERDDREVARRIRAGETDFITGTGWALLDKFFIFLEEIGFYDVLREVKGEGYQRSEDYQSIHKVIVYSGPYFGIFDIEEYTIIIRSPPKDFARTDIAQTTKRLGLED